MWTTISQVIIKISKIYSYTLFIFKNVLYKTIEYGGGGKFENISSRAEEVKNTRKAIYGKKTTHFFLYLIVIRVYLSLKLAEK